MHTIQIVRLATPLAFEEALKLNDLASVYLCLHDAYDALMACYEKAASEYDEVNEIRQYYFQSAASLILRRSFRDRDEFAPTLITTYVVQFLAFSSILSCAQCI